MSKKGVNEPIFMQFVNANKALIECYEGIDPEQYKGKENTTSNVCLPQKQKVKDILASNSMTMTRVVKERVAIMQAIQSEQFKHEAYLDEPM